MFCRRAWVSWARSLRFLGTRLKTSRADMVSGCVGRLISSTRRSIKARSRNIGRANKQGPGDDYKAGTDYAQVRGMSSKARARTDYA